MFSICWCFVSYIYIYIRNSLDPTSICNIKALWTLFGGVGPWGAGVPRQRQQFSPQGRIGAVVRWDAAYSADGLDSALPQIVDDSGKGTLVCSAG